MQHNRKIIYFAGFLYFISLALTYYINSSFLASWVGEKLVGVAYTLASLLAFLSLLALPKIFKKIGAYRFLIYAGTFSALSYLGLALASTPWSAVSIFILSFTFNILVLFSLDEFLKIFSRNNEIGRIRGVYLIVNHLALISIQLAYFAILGSLSFQSIYLLSFAFTILFILSVTYSLKKIPEPSYDNVSTFAFVGIFFKRRELLRAYILNFLLQLFYAWMIIYTPIYLSLHLGFSWKEIGIILAIMLLPFIFIPYYTGAYGDKFGERKMLIWGFVVAAGTTLLLTFVKIEIVWIWAFLLFLTRIGASLVEEMSDAYFFKHINAENEEFISVYRTASPAAYIFGPLLASYTIFVVPSMSFLFTVLAVIMFFGAYLAFTIRKDDI